MSLEAKIEDLTAAIHALVAAMGARSVAAPAAAPAVVTITPAAPVAAPAPVVPAMPAPPVFAPPAPVAPAATLPKAPFTDQKSLIDYVMSSYKTLGVAKGAQIQQVLVSLGHQNINDVKPENYDALFAGVEALKA
jgi:2-oxoglutarate dehydrogenase E2 component (dihydrolipoamide succinyltransferase)